jgi:hypothetical protein
VHSTRQFEQKNIPRTTCENKSVSYQQMLEENLSQMALRLKRSENQEISDFSTVGKDR